MFIRCGIEVNQPFARVAKALLEGPEGWLPALLQVAHDHVVTRLFFENGRHSVSRDIKVRIGEPTRSSDYAELPISWSAREHPELFPVLEGHIEACAQNPGTTWVSLNAVYTPPGGLLGLVADRLLLHHVAQSTVRDFVDRVAGVMERNAWSQAVAVHPNLVAGPDD